MADRNQNEATRTMRKYGFWTFKIPDNDPRAKRGDYEKGTPDLICLRPDGNAYVEVKRGNGTSWAFASWSPAQRKWAQFAVDEGFDYWLFIGIGNMVNSKKNPRRTILVPAQEIWDLEVKVQRLSLSYSMLETEFSHYQLEWEGNNTWRIPDDHVFWDKYNSRFGTSIGRPTNRRNTKSKRSIAHPRARRTRVGQSVYSTAKSSRIRHGTRNTHRRTGKHQRNDYQSARRNGQRKALPHFTAAIP